MEKPGRNSREPEKQPQNTFEQKRMRGEISLLKAKIYALVANKKAYPKNEVDDNGDFQSIRVFSTENNELLYYEDVAGIKALSEKFADTMSGKKEKDK